VKHHWFLYAPEAQWPFDDEVTQWLGRNSDWSYEGRGSGLFLYRRSKRAPAKTLQAWLDEAVAEAKEFARRIPPASLDSTIDDGPPVFGQGRVFRFKVSGRFTN
jgi:hypothetical protein